MPETPVPPASLTGAVPPGFVLAGRYALVRLIARGGMADVWEAKDTLLERQVAVKILHPHLAADSAFVSRFRTEAIAAARLHHRAIVAIFDTCSDSGVEAIVMELARGHTLREEIDRHGALDPVVVINIGVDVADALQSAHAAGLIHRDVKPANILLCDDQRVMVTDFGIAKVRDNSDRTQTGTMLGSVKYVSPEQVEGNPVDPRSDVYSLGVVLYEALTGHPPFVADTPAATALARLHATPRHPRQVRPDAPQALADLIMKAMALDPARRFASASDLRAALLAIRLDPRGVTADPTQVTPKTSGRTGGRGGGRPGVGRLGRSASPPPPPPPPSPVPSPPRPAPPPADPRPPSPARWGALVAAALLIGMALVIAAILVFQNQGARQGDSTSPTATGAPGATSEATAGGGDASPTGQPVALASVRAFDPDGDGGESDNLASDAIDGDPATDWRTQHYPTRTFTANAKTGVGLVARLDSPASLSKLVVTSDSRDWAAEVYVSGSSGSSLADWGDPVDTVDAAGSGETTFDLEGHEGEYVLLWITRLGADPGPYPQGINQYVVRVYEIEAYG